MAQRKSGFVRQPNETYETPSWCVDALAEHLCLDGVHVWEPCAASGQLARALELHCGRAVEQSDLNPRLDAPPYSRTLAQDFLAARPPFGVEAIITNPPWGLGGRTAVRFIERGLEHLRLPGGSVRLVAFLLAVDFDSASTRVHVFRDCLEFSLKVVLLRRIRWFEGPSGPSTNHSWFVWQRPSTSIRESPRVVYAPIEAQASIADL